jgi:hypothetical protein
MFQHPQLASKTGSERYFGRSSDRREEKRRPFDPLNRMRKGWLRGEFRRWQRKEN